MFYAYIFLGAGILILSILFRLAAVFRLTIPLLYALVVPTLLSDWYYAHYTLANVIWYILLAVTVLSCVYSLVRKLSAIMEASTAAVSSILTTCRINQGPSVPAPAGRSS